MAARKNNCVDARKKLGSEAYSKRRCALIDESKSQKTTVFRRRLIHQHDPRFRKKHNKCSKHNGLTVEQVSTGSILRGRASVALHKFRQARLQCNTMMCDLWRRALRNVILSYARVDYWGTRGDILHALDGFAWRREMYMKMLSACIIFACGCRNNLLRYVKQYAMFTWMLAFWMTSNDRCADSAHPLIHKYELIKSQCDAKKHNSDHPQLVTELGLFFSCSGRCLEIALLMAASVLPSTRPPQRIFSSFFCSFTFSFTIVISLQIFVSVEWWVAAWVSFSLASSRHGKARTACSICGITANVCDEVRTNPYRWSSHPGQIFRVRRC